MDTNRKEERDREEASCSFRASALKGERKEDRHDSRTILPRRSFHRESGVVPIPDDEPTAPGEEPPQRESRRRRNRRRNIRRHHEAGERDPEQPRILRRGLRDRRDSGGTRLLGTKEFPTA